MCALSRVNDKGLIILENIGTWVGKAARILYDVTFFSIRRIHPRFKNSLRDLTLRLMQARATGMPIISVPQEQLVSCGFRCSCIDCEVSYVVNISQNLSTEKCQVNL